MKEESTSENSGNAKENARFSSFKETATERKSTMKTTEKKAKTCPDCGKKMKKGERLYGMFRNRYPGGHAYVCQECYIGEKPIIPRLYPR